MTLFKDRFRIQSARLTGWDYTSPGWYFVTICTAGRECLLGAEVNSAVRMSPIGEIARRFWMEIPDHFARVSLDAFVVMPNHVHGIVVIGEGEGDLGQDNVRDRDAGDRDGGRNREKDRGDRGGGRDAACCVSTNTNTNKYTATNTDSNSTTQNFTRTYRSAPRTQDRPAKDPKSGSLSAIVRSYKSAVTRWCNLNGYPVFQWQPRFYDSVIRDEDALYTIRQYILENPSKWALDIDNPANRR